jgi:hypothetical protein
MEKHYFNPILEFTRIFRRPIEAGKSSLFLLGVPEMALDVQCEGYCKLAVSAQRR